MPMTVTIDPARRLAVTCAVGVLTFEDLAETRHSLRINPAFDPRFSQLMDLSGMTSIAFLTSTLDEIASESVFASGARRAFVATTPFQFGIAQMFASFAERHRHVTQLFPDRAAAERWLNDGDGKADNSGAAR